MAKTRIAGALVAVVLASCSVEEPEQTPSVLRPAPAGQSEGKQEAVDRKESDDTQTAPVTTAGNGAAENAGLRADFSAP